MILRGELAQAGNLRLRHRNAQHHALLFERDDEQVELEPGNFLRFNVDHAADTMGRINHEIALLKGKFLRLRRCLLRLRHIKSLHVKPRIQRYRDPPRTLPCVLDPEVRIGKLLSATDEDTEPAADRTPDRFLPDPYTRDLGLSRG
jgi:hypothetical protein